MSGKQRNIRKRAASEEPEDGGEDGEPECQRDKLTETRMMQQLRKRTAGTGVGALAMGLGGERVARAGSEEPGVGAGARSSPAPEGLAGAPVMDTYVKAKSIATQQGEDPHMQKYIEEQLAARLGKSAAQQQEDEQDPEVRRKKLEAELYAVPPDFQSSLEQEVVLPGLASTLTEVPLSAKDKLASIEQTEALKRRLLAKVGQGTLVLEEEEEARQREAARIRRGMFTKSFGRKPDKPLWTPEQMEAEARKRRVVTEKAPAGGGRK